MKAKLFIIIAGIFSLTSCFKEKVATDQEFSFIKFSGQSYSTSGKDVKQLADGSYVAVGTTLVNDNNDMYLAKFDKYGNEIWHKTYGDKNDQTGNSLQVLADGSFILAGNTQVSDKLSKIFLVKTNSIGDSIWTRIIGDTTSMFAYNLQISSSGGYILAGSYLTNGVRNSQLVFTDDAGKNPIFSPSFYSQYNNEAKYVTEVKTGGYIFMGYTTTSNGTSDIILGSFRYDKQYLGNTPYGGDALSDSGACVKQLADGNFICTGTYATSDSGTNVWIMKFSNDTVSSGYIPLWIRRYGSLYNDNSNDIQIVSDNEFAITGYQGNKYNTTNIFFMTIDGAGNLIQPQSYINTATQLGERVITTKDGGFLIVGTNTTSGNSVMTLIKTKKDGGL